MPIVGFMNNKIQSHEECPCHGYVWDGKIGDYDKSEPLCYNHEVKSLGLFETVPLCGRGDPVKLDSAEYCAACGFFPEKHKQDVRFS